MYRIKCFKEVLHTIALRYFVRKNVKRGHIGKNSHIHTPSLVSEGSLDNIYIGNNCNIDWNNVLYCSNAKFIMKDNSGAAVGLTVVTGNHVKQPRIEYKKGDNTNLSGKDIIVEEDVWIAANVTLLAGAHVGRGAIVGAGSVIRTCKVPPYAIVMGNPAKVIGFKWSIDDIIEHEKVMYPEKDRIPEDILRNNYKTYYIDRRKEIRSFLKL